MTEYVYLYEPRGYYPGYVYRSFDDAVDHMLKDNRVNSIDDMIDELPDGWYYEITDESVYFDDGERISKLELR